MDVFLPVVAIFFLTVGQLVRCDVMDHIKWNEDGTGTVNMKMPTLTAEETDSHFMPDIHKCQACQGIAYQLWTAFDAFNEKRPSLKYKIPESELLDLTEEVCGQDTWMEYGVVEKTDGKKHLSGPGLKSVGTAIISKGRFWPNRLRTMCTQYMGDLGETVVYDAYREAPETTQSLEDFLCRGDSDLQGKCVGVEEEEEEEKKPEEVDEEDQEEADEGEEETEDSKDEL